MLWCVCVCVCVCLWCRLYLLVHCPWISLWLPLLSSFFFFFFKLYCTSLNEFCLFVCLFFCIAHGAVVCNRGFGLISISWLLIILSLLRQFYHCLGVDILMHTHMHGWRILTEHQFRPVNTGQHKCQSVAYLDLITVKKYKCRLSNPSSSSSI